MIDAFVRIFSLSDQFFFSLSYTRFYFFSLHIFYPRSIIITDTQAPREEM